MTSEYDRDGLHDRLQAGRVGEDLHSVPQASVSLARRSSRRSRGVP